MLKGGTGIPPGLLKSMHCGASCHAYRTAAGLNGGSMTIVSVTLLLVAL